MTFYIEIFNTPCPNPTPRYRVWETYPGKALSPTLIAFYTTDAQCKEEALAKTLLGQAITLISPQGEHLEMVNHPV